MSDRSAISIGSAQVILLNAGDMRVRLADEYAVPEEQWRPLLTPIFLTSPSILPSLSVYVESHGVRVLVDANDYRATVTPDSPYALADYTPPAPLVAQLADLGV